jgi:hypothetical protein
MPAESDEEARREAESIARQTRMMEQRRGDTEQRTSNALRRIVLVVATTALVALALWALMD